MRSGSPSAAILFLAAAIGAQTLPDSASASVSAAPVDSLALAKEKHARDSLLAADLDSIYRAEADKPRSYKTLPAEAPWEVGYDNGFDRKGGCFVRQPGLVQRVTFNGVDTTGVVYENVEVGRFGAPFARTQCGAPGALSLEDAGRHLDMAYDRAVRKSLMADRLVRDGAAGVFRFRLEKRPGF